MAVRRAHEVTKHHARLFDVVNVVALALGEARVLDSLARAAETLQFLHPLFGGCGLFAHCAASVDALRVSAAARMDLTMFW